MVRPRTNINRIIFADLCDIDRLVELYVQAIERRIFCPNNERSLLDFCALAEKALEEDKRGTPEQLLAWLVKNVRVEHITNAQEIRAERKLLQIDKRAVIELAEERLNPKSGWHIRADIGESREIIADEEIAYVPAIMTQVFFPQKAPPPNQDMHESEHGKATVFVRRGVLMHPEWPEVNKTELCQIPSGAKARIVLSYAVTTALRDQTRVVDMGPSLRKFMGLVGMPITGYNAKEITQQVKNIASAHIIFGYWGEKRVIQRNEFIASAVDFWIEKDENQLTIWNPKLELSKNFYDLIQVSNMPFLMPHVIQLSKSPRRMDLYMFLCHRTPRIPPGKPAHIPLGALQRIFAPDIQSPRYFKQCFKQDLKAILKVYPKFRIEIRGDMMTLWNSPSPVPPRPAISVPKNLTDPPKNSPC